MTKIQSSAARLKQAAASAKLKAQKIVARLKRVSNWPKEPGNKLILNGVSILMFFPFGAYWLLADLTRQQFHGLMLLSISAFNMLLAFCTLTADEKSNH